MKWNYTRPWIFRISKLENYIIMSKNIEKVYYAVGQGREIGVYNSWKDCKVQVDGVQNAKYRRFYLREEAEAYVNFWKNYSIPVREKSEQFDVGLDVTEDKDFKETKHLNETLSPLTESSNSVGMVKQEPEDISQFITSPYKSLECSSSHSSSDNVVKNVDILALNLRLDSFEKRFDTCLKEIGGILSQITNLRAEITEIKELLTLVSNFRSGCSPRKSKEGMLQTVLNFGTDSRVGYGQSACSVDNKTSSTVESSYSSRPQKSSQYEGNDSKEINDKKRSLKRKLSKNSLDDSRRDSDSDENDEHTAVRLRRISVDPSSFTVDEDNYVEVYTDGACHFNGISEKKVKAGIGIWFGDNHPFNVGEPVEGPATSNTAEIQAARVAVDLAIMAGITKLKIYTDSEFLINCITKWIHKWKKNGWKLVDGGRVKNRKELEKLDKVASKISVRWEKVAGHTGIKGNEMADRLANEGAAKYVCKK